MLVAVRWWPPDIPFDMDDLLTVAKVLEDQHKRRF